MLAGARLRSGMRWYRGKKVFITGGSSGIGKATAMLLARWGASVVICARNQQRLGAALEEIEAAAASNGVSGQRFAAMSVDVRKREAVQAAASEVIDRLGGLDVLIINQGYALTGYIQDMPDALFDDMLETNFLGHVYVTRAFLPHFMKQRHGHICLVSSMLGFMGFFGYSAYAASKHAIAGFARCLRNELKPHNIKVSLVYPPTTNTPGLEKENADKVPEAWAIEEGSQAMEADEVATAMLEGISKGKFEMVPGFSNWLIWTAYRYAPQLVDWVIDNDLRKFQRSHRR